MRSSTTKAPDVLIAGAGVAGLAAAISFSRRGLRVRCIEPARGPRLRVGESLDWSAPHLLESIGIPSGEIVASRAGTYKREVHGFTTVGRHLVAGPPDWFGRWPLRFETTTIHVDRRQFDERLFQAAIDAGVDFVWDRVNGVQMRRDRVVSFSTSSGTEHAANWFVDASGRSRLIGRSARIGVRTWGNHRIALWAHRPTPVSVQGTVLHLDDQRDDLSWAWEIPISTHSASVGVVVPVEEFREIRRQSGSMERTFTAMLERFPDLEPPSLCDPPFSRTYRPYMSERTVGANWVMIGEAAALIDPLSSVGVTQALRQGAESAASIADSPRDPAVILRRLRRLERRTRFVGSLYNQAVNDLLYQPELRHQLGFKAAARAYVIPGYLTNALYTRLQPQDSAVREYAVGATVAFFRRWARMWVTASAVAGWMSAAPSYLKALRCQFGSVQSDRRWAGAAPVRMR